MICDNCGKSNATGITTCAYCGSEMPKTTECAGFGDILTYKAPEPVVPMTGVGMSDDSGRVSDADMKNLLRKSDSIMRGTKFNLLLLGVCTFMLLISIVIGVYTVSKVSSLEDSLNNTKVEVPVTPGENEDEEKDKKTESYISDYSENNYENFANILTEIVNVEMDDN